MDSSEINRHAHDETIAGRLCTRMRNLSRSSKALRRREGISHVSAPSVSLSYIIFIKINIYIYNISYIYIRTHTHTHTYTRVRYLCVCVRACVFLLNYIYIYISIFIILIIYIYISSFFISLIHNSARTCVIYILFTKCLHPIPQMYKVAEETDRCENNVGMKRNESKA